MSERTFDRETILDLTVNFIPLGIILFFVVLFLAVRPWDPNLYMETMSMGLLVIPFAVLVLVTYVAGGVITEAEAGGEAADAEGPLTETDAELTEATANPNPEGADEDDDMVEDRLDAEPESDTANDEPVESDTDDETAG